MGVSSITENVYEQTFCRHMSNKRYSCYGNTFAQKVGSSIIFDNSVFPAHNLACMPGEKYFKISSNNDLHSSDTGDKYTAPSQPAGECERRPAHREYDMVFAVLPTSFFAIVNASYLIDNKSVINLDYLWYLSCYCCTLDLTCTQKLKIELKP